MKNNVLVSHSADWECLYMYGVEWEKLLLLINYVLILHESKLQQKNMYV